MRTAPESLSYAMSRRRGGVRDDASSRLARDRPGRGDETRQAPPPQACRSDVSVCSGVGAGRYGVCAAAIGVGETSGAILKKVPDGGIGREIEQPLLGPRVGFNRTIDQDVADFEPTRRERAADQKAAMAIQRLAFGAHDADATATAPATRCVE